MPAADRPNLPEWPYFSSSDHRSHTQGYDFVLPRRAGGTTGHTLLAHTSYPRSSNPPACPRLGRIIGIPAAVGLLQHLRTTRPSCSCECAPDLPPTPVKPRHTPLVHKSQHHRNCPDLASHLLTIMGELCALTNLHLVFFQLHHSKSGGPPPLGRHFGIIMQRHAREFLAAHFVVGGCVLCCSLH